MQANTDGQEYSLQRHTSTVNGKEITMDHPVSYVSGLFYGSQLELGCTHKRRYADLHVH